MIPLVGGISNAIRGGQWKDWYPTLPSVVMNTASDMFNGLIYAITVLIVSGNMLLAGLSGIAMYIGASMPGWGDYIGALFGSRKDNLKESWLIDPLIRPLTKWPEIWGAAGLFLRGLLWGILLAAPCYLLGYTAAAASFIITGPTMPLMYLLAHRWLTYRTGINDPGASWGLGEVFYGAILWSSLYAI